MKGDILVDQQQAAVPMKLIGPVKIIGAELKTETKIPLATFETPLWASVNRGAKISRLVGGIKATVIKDNMTRSILVEAPDATYANKVIAELDLVTLQQIVSSSSKFAKLEEINTQIVGNLLYIRFALQTGDAAGHNMVTLASDYLMNYLLEKYSELKYVSVSGNYCTDKKVSSVNGILGRGKYVVAEINIPRDVCIKHLKNTPEQLVDLNIKKNLIGTVLAGGVRTANAHFANMLLAFYLATGQDAANIVEGSQGITHAEVRNKDLYFSVTLPNIIVGTIGNGKDLEFVQNNLELLGCVDSDMVGASSRRLAIIAAATVLCGELSLLAALCNKGELMRSHVTLERTARKEK